MPVYFNVAPKTTAGIVATTKQTTKLLSRPFKFPEKNLEALAIMAFTSVQKNVVTAIRLPRWTEISIRSPWSSFPLKVGNKIR